MDYSLIKAAHIASETAMQANQVAVSVIVEMEAVRQREVIGRALMALGAGESEKAREILKELQTPQARKAIHDAD